MRDKLITIAAVIVVVGLAVAFNRYYRQGRGPAPPPPRDFSAEAAGLQEKGKKLIATVETNKGTFSFELLADVAPGTVENFVKLAKKGFYDGTIFHRVIPDFVIQGGDPTGTGRGGPGYTIKAEFSRRRHVPGTVGMARSGAPDSAGSQFYVCLSLAPNLDGKYTVFGQVIEGMDAVQAIGRVPIDRNQRPIEKVVMNKVTVKQEPSGKK